MPSASIQTGKEIAHEKALPASVPRSLSYAHELAHYKAGDHSAGRITKGMELAADREAVELLREVDGIGDPVALYMETLKWLSTRSSKPGFWDPHPSFEERLQNIFRGTTK